MKGNFAGYKIHGWRGFFFLKDFKYAISLSSGLHGFLIQNLFILWGIPTILQIPFLLLQSKSSLSFDNFTMIASILLGICWAFWIYMSMCYIRFGIFLATISSNVFSAPLSLSLSSRSRSCSHSLSLSLYLSGILMMCMLVCWWYPTGSSVHFPLSPFISVLHDGKFQLSCLHVRWSFPVPFQICFWIHLMIFFISIIVLYSSKISVLVLFL